jgi:hypothetical protein
MTRIADDFDSIRRRLAELTKTTTVTDPIPTQGRRQCDPPQHPPQRVPGVARACQTRRPLGAFGCVLAAAAQ